MLLSCVAELRRKNKEWRNLKLYGQEVNLITSAIARMNLVLHGIEDFAVVRGDTLAAPAFTDGDRLRQFDVALANPPYSVKQWNRAAWESDPYGRNIYGVPPHGRADYAFFQHIIAGLNPKSGRCAILFPHGVLFRDEETSMRNKLIEHDVLECIIGLGPNLFYNSPMEACIVVCRMSKPKARRGKVLIINAVDDVTRERAQSFLEPAYIEKIVGTYRAFADADGFAHVASLDEIRANDGSLNIALYVRPKSGAAGPGDGKTLEKVLAEWQQSSVALRKSMEGLLETLGKAGAKG
jgi:type I restriction enzyme M protein